MQRFLFFFYLALISNFSRAQLVDFNKEVADRTPDTLLLIDENKFNDPKFLAFPKKLNVPLNLASLINYYPVVGISLKNRLTDNISLLSISQIRLIDARFDNKKIGFLPVGTNLQKSGYSTLGLQISRGPISWLKESFIEKNIILDSSSKRQLVIVLQKFWFSSSANQLYSVSNPRLLATLHYGFDIYTSPGIGYYPQKKIEGSFTTLYNKGNAYTDLTDSLLILLKKEFLSQNFAAKETDANWQSPIDFNDYYNTKMRKVSQFEKMPIGVYATYADFLEKNVMCDSVKMIMKYNNYDRIPLYACQLVAFTAGQRQSSKESWGYFDGTSLFLNTGAGFFIKLIRTKEDYVFFHLKNIREDRIKQDILEGIQIGSSSYQVIRDYTKVFALTFQMDTETGQLY